MRNVNKRKIQRRNKRMSLYA